MRNAAIAELTELARRDRRVMLRLSIERAGPTVGG